MIQFGVFSLWTGTTDFYFTRGSAMMFSAAVAYAGAFFADMELVTDIRGLEIADRLGWRFRSFSTALEDFCPPEVRHVWMLGKVRAQQIQSRPHVHIDLDLILLKALPNRMLLAAVIGQSKDHPKSYHDPFVREIIAYTGIVPHAAPINTGLIGWNDMAFCRDYCERSMGLSIHAGKKFSHGGCVSIICEQLLLADMARERRVHVEVAIPLAKHCGPRDMKDVQFLHLWGTSKRNPAWLDKVERRFAEDHPVEYLRFLDGWSAMSGEERRDDYLPYNLGMSRHGTPIGTL